MSPVGPMRAVVALAVSALAAGCSIEVTSPAPEPKTLSSASQPSSAAPCDGKVRDGLLGAWGRDAPDGTHAVHRFCGTPSGGSYHYEEDRAGVDRRGTFSFDGTRLVITIDGASTSSPGSRNETFEAKVDGDRLVLRRPDGEMLVFARE